MKPNHNPTFHRTVAITPEWKAWVRHNDIHQLYDVEAVMQTGMIPPQHLADFVAFSVDQYVIATLLNLRPHTKITPLEFDAIVRRFSL